jgi:hypothetical protein
MGKSMWAVLRPVLAQKLGDMAGDAWISRIRQTHFLEANSPTRFGVICRCATREKAIYQDSFDLFIAQFSPESSTDNTAAAPKNREWLAVSMLGLEKEFFCRSAALSQTTQLPGIEFGAFGSQALLNGIR